MARKTKDSIDYFSHDVDMLQDKKIKLLKAKFGLIGYAVFLRLLEELYRSTGYYLFVDEEFNILFCDDNNLDYNVYIEILNDCIERGLFNILKYNDYDILTSRRIQNNYIEATFRRKNVSFVKEYLLVDPKLIYNIQKTNVDILALNVDINPQRKGKERKRKENKENILSVSENDSENGDDLDLPDFDSENEKYFAVFDHWNDQEGLITHKELTADMKKAIGKAYKSFKTAETINELITRYSTAINDQDYYWSYKWTLINFLNQKNAIREFTDEGSKWVDYQSREHKGKKSFVTGKFEKPSDLPPWVKADMMEG